MIIMMPTPIEGKRGAKVWVFSLCTDFHLDVFLSEDQEESMLDSISRSEEFTGISTHRIGPIAPVSNLDFMPKLDVFVGLRGAAECVYCFWDGATGLWVYFREVSLAQSLVFMASLNWDLLKGESLANREVLAQNVQKAVILGVAKKKLILRWGVKICTTDNISCLFLLFSLYY